MCNVNTYKPCSNQQLLEEFVDSGLECAKVEGWTTKNAANCATSLNTSRKRYHMGGFKAISRGNDVFLIKTKY